MTTTTRARRAWAGKNAKPRQNTAVQTFRMPASPEDMAEPRVYYHGGPPGLRGQTLPRSVTGAPSMLDECAKDDPDQIAGAIVRDGLVDALSPPSRCYVTTNLVIAAHAAALRAAVTGRNLGAVYAVQPHGAPVPDYDLPCSWICESAAIEGSRRWIVERPVFPVLYDWVLSPSYLAARERFDASLTAADVAATLTFLCQEANAVERDAIMRRLLRRWGHVPALAAGLLGTTPAEMEAAAVLAQARAARYGPERAARLRLGELLGQGVSTAEAAGAVDSLPPAQRAEALALLERLYLDGLPGVPGAPAGPARSAAGMAGDGNGWTECGQGHRHWGIHGAAGLLAYAGAEAGQPCVLLVRRADWTQHGGTWGPPGGARDSHEPVAAAALREAAEECGVPPGAVRVQEVVRDDHGGWSYETVVAAAQSAFPVRAASRESTEAAWVPVADVGSLPLHPGFAQTWPVLRNALEAVTTGGGQP